MNANAAPQTLVDEVKISIEEALHLSAQDSLQDVMQKGLYETLDESPVVIFDGPEVIAVTTAGKLRGEILPRSWSGLLGDRLGRLSLPPEVTAHTRVAALDFLVQQVPDADWLVVVDDETGQPVGVLSRTVVLGFIPPPDTTVEVYRAAPMLLWGDPSVEHAFYYCPVEKRYYAPHAVHPDAEGRMRDRRGHLVEKCESPETPRGGDTC